jgi:hypothetical protein
MRSTLVAPAFLALAACSAIVPSTAARLAAFDPLTADPAGIELLVVLPPGLSVTPGTAKLEFGAVRGTESRKGSFVLADRPVTDGLDLPDLATDGATARRYALTPADAKAMRALQAEIAKWKQDGNAQGSLGLGVGGCATGTGPAPDATGSVLIRLEDQAAFLPLIDQGKLADLLGAAALAAIKPCNGAE